MSAKPYPEGVAQLSGYLRDLQDARQTIARENEVIALHREKLNAATANEKAAQNAIAKSMREMDVESPGNFGYEGRMLWLLRELNTQAEQYGKESPMNSASMPREGMK